MHGHSDWTIVGVAVALVMGIAAIWAARTWGPRRGKLLLTWEAAPLLRQPEVGTAGAAWSGDLEVAFKGIPVLDPHLVKLRLVNVGPSDISTARFDNGRPLRVELDGSRFFGIVNSSLAAATQVPAIGGDGYAALAPTLLKKGASWEVAVIASGMPAPRVSNILVDCDVVERTTADVVATAARTLMRHALPSPMDILFLAAASVTESVSGRSRRA